MIGIIGAMDQEVQGLKDTMKDKVIFNKAGMDFVEGKIYGKDVVVVKCGVGKVNAAICAQILADRYDLQCVINTGAAGGLLSDINIGDIVIATDAVQHDMNATDLGARLGQIPYTDMFAFEADEYLSGVAEECCKRANPELSVFHGRVVSGDEFISKASRKAYLVENFNPACAEMEGAAIAQTCYLNHVPFIILRAISDKADDSAEMDFPTFSAMASKNSIKMILNMLEVI